MKRVVKRSKQRDERSEKMVKRSKQRDEMNVNDPFTKIPLEMKVEILMKLPARAIARLRFASKHLSSIISGKDFTNMYMARSSTQPRHLISVYSKDTQMQLFHSCSQEDSLSSDHDMVSYTLAPNLRYEFTPPVHGLICGRDGIKMVVGNPSTGQFLTLPRVKTRRKDIFSVFGYDPVNHVYKVLCMTVRCKMSRDTVMDDDMAREAIISEEHQVITLGAKPKWRMIECKYPHRHYSGSQGICRDGVLYYLAKYNQKRTLMSFDLSSEEFNVTKLPDDYTFQQFGHLLNHSGKITILTRTYEGQTDLWVLEDANKRVWSKAASIVPHAAHMFGRDRGNIRFYGILGTGEIILSPFPYPNPFFFICYHLKNKVSRKVVIEGIGPTGDVDDAIQVFFDHVESYTFL